MVRPEGFDLEEAWQETLATLDEHRVPAVATLRAHPVLVPQLRAVLGTPMAQARTLDDGRVELELRSYSAERIASQLAGFGGRVEVVAPEEVRRHLQRIATELTALYGPSGP